MPRTEVASLVFEAETGDLVTAKKRLESLNGPAKKVEQSSQGVTRAFRAQRGATQQAAFQIQDFAVQVGSGQSALRAFNQQAPQFLSIFGPAGAILGGVVAVGAALASAFIPSLLDSKSATEQLSLALETLDLATKKADDDIIDITKSLRELEAVSKVAFRAEITEQIFKAEEALEETRKSIVDLIIDSGELTSGFIPVVRAFKNGEITARVLADAYNGLPLDKANKGFRETRAELEKLAQGSTKVEDRLNRLRQALSEDSSGSTEAGRKEESELVKKTQARNDRLEKLEREREAREAARQLESSQNRLFRLEDSFRTQEEVIRDKYNEQEAIIRGAEQRLFLAEEEAAELRLRNQEQFNTASAKLDLNRTNSLSGFFGQTAGILQDGLGEQNAITKAAFAAQKLLAIPQMIVGVQTGIAQALALGPIVGPPLAALVGGLGASAIGTVVGTTLAGRAQGGQVRPGEAYRVGEFGPETLVMGSSGGVIVPQQQKTSQGVNLVTNVKVIGLPEGTPVSNNVDRLSDTKFVQNIVIGEMTNTQSRGFRGMSQVSNLQPRGTR